MTPPDVSLPALLGAAALISINVGLSFRLKLGLERRMLVAAARCALQLAAMGLVLRQVFEGATWWTVLPLLLVMVGLASHASVSRVEERPKWLMPLSFVAMLTTSALVTGVTLAVLVPVRPWYEPRFIVPVVGMLLGNSLTGISLGFRELLTIARREREVLELHLRLGGNRFGVLRDPVRRSLTAGLIPIVNSMTVAGIVSLPGMMTGQLIAGAEVGHAVRYQILIFFLIAAATGLGLGVGVFLAARRLLDQRLNPVLGASRPSSPQPSSGRAGTRQR